MERKMGDYHYVYRDVEGASIEWENFENCLPKQPAFKPSTFKNNLSIKTNLFLIAKLTRNSNTTSP
ncbi:hypothetical protein SADUNF_Sadunf07G0059900 [Salix dunnii]|uniref:Uncharacterized protein n=1 Tax=Salix dunnii TaxID=1413687 RepID=A0A835JVW2_9ROSI|nr:hypothetical protein SADUNF_Sadunf07G0059900 [Salix dunnii]